MQPFRFDPEAHAYYLGDEQIPGVTAVLSQVVSFDFVRDEVLDRKRAIGSALHSAIELDRMGVLDEDSVDPAVRPYFDGWRAWLGQQSCFTIHAGELPVCSRVYRYGCTPDVWGELQIGEVAVPFVMELKSSTTVHPAVGLQTAAQARAIAETIHDGRRAAADLWISTARRFVLQLLPTGKYSLRELTARDDFATFLALLTAYRWKKRHNIGQ